MKIEVLNLTEENLVKAPEWEAHPLAASIASTGNIICLTPPKPESSRVWFVVRHGAL